MIATVASETPTLSSFQTIFKFSKQLTQMSSIYFLGLTSILFYLERFLCTSAFSDCHHLRTCHADAVLEVNRRRVDFDNGRRIFRKSLSDGLGSEHVGSAGQSDKDFTPWLQTEE